MAATNEPIRIQRPLTPLRDTVLMTNSRGQTAIGHEIAAEIDSADRIDLVLAFIRRTGLRDLLQPFRHHIETGKPLRIITTTYTGSTEQRALQALVDLGAQVKVSYDTTTRLHAKAWLFRRNTGFSTVYIGSSNLRFSAQVAGQAKTDRTGRTMPYFCAGTANYVEHRNERPMQITWHLDRPLPGDTFAT